MPRKKQNVTAYGKQWRPIDIQNLEKAVELYERLNYLQDHFADSLSGASSIMNQINETSEIQNKLRELGIKLSKEECETVIKLYKDQQKVNEELDKAKNLHGSTYGVLTGGTNATNPYNKTNTQYYKSSSQGTLTQGNFGSSVAGALQDRQAIKNEMNRLRASGSIMSDASLERIAAMNVKNGNAVMSDDMKASAGRFKLGADVLQTAVNTFSSAVNTFKEIALRGLRNQTSVYEDTFEGISVRTNTTRSEYYDAQWHTNNELSELGLRNNIATSEVQQMWSKLASIGADQDMMFERAIDNVVTNKIVPYLDTTSIAVNLLNNRIDGRFVKDIRGISQANLDIAGNNYATQELLNTIIDQVQPMSDKALEDLAQGSTEVTALIGQLIEGGMAPDVAKSYATKYFKMQKYSDQIMNSGTVAEKMSLTNVLSRGDLNLYDLKDANNIMGLTIDTEMGLVGNTPGYKDSMSGLITNVVGNTLGINYDTTSSLLNLRSKGITGYTAAGNSDLTQETMQHYIDIATNSFTEDKNQTNKQLQDVTLENLMNELAVMDEYLGNWTRVLETAIKGVGGLLLTYLGGKFLTSLASGGVGKTLTSLLASSKASSTGMKLLTGAKGVLAGAGGIALGTIGGVAAVVGIANAIKSASDPGESKYGQEEAEKEIGEKFAIDETMKQIQGVAAAESYNSENGAVQNLAEEVGDAFGATWMGIKKGSSYLWNKLTGKKYDEKYESRNAEFYKYMIAGAIKGDTDQDRTGLLYAYAYLLNEIDSLGTMELLGSPITKQQLKDYANGPEYEHYNVDHWVNQIIEGGYAPSGLEYQKATDPNVKNYLRIGMNYVPYDNYPALLHEGEAVLTASTAEQLRSLLDEYRQTNQQTINFETIIQTQTQALCNKLDQVIIAVQTGRNTMPSTQQSSLLDNMINFRTTKAFGN